MRSLDLRHDEVAVIEALLDRLVARFRTAEEPEFLAEVGLLAHELPSRVRGMLHGFRLAERDGVALVRGFPVDDEALGPTPSRWTGPGGRPVREALLLALYSSLLGDLFGWRTQQDGALIHDVLPVRDHEHEQIGTGSRQGITWHTEDAAYDCRGDYVTLLCLRNPGAVPTSFTEAQDLALPRRVSETLAEPRFLIAVDQSHRLTGAARADAHDRARVAVLLGDLDDPYLRADPFYMPPADDADAAGAFAEFVRAIDAALQEVTLEPGDCLVVDNYRAVHGRGAFVPAYDGRDRWLKRANVTRDLRRSRRLRPSAQDRVVVHAR